VLRLLLQNQRRPRFDGDEFRRAFLTSV
jgi:hypothetical protein